MGRKFYNSTQWGIQESELDKLRSKGIEHLRSIGCNTGEFYSLSIEKAIKNPTILDDIFKEDVEFVILLEPKDRNKEKIGRFGVKSKKTLYEMINEIDSADWQKYNISIVEQIQKIENEFVGVAISDGRGKLFIEFLRDTTNSKHLTSTGANPTKLDFCYFSDFETISEFPKKIPFEIVEKIQKSCHFFEGYYEFVYGKSKDKVDIFFTFYSDILEYRNLLKKQVEFSNQEISSRLKYNYIQQRKYFNYKQGTKEDEER